MRKDIFFYTKYKYYRNNYVKIEMGKYIFLKKNNEKHDILKNKKKIKLLF
jgi:hypothetical protein